MKNPLQSSGAANLGMLLVRIPVGAFFAIAGFNKFRMGVGNFVQMGIGLGPKSLPEPLLRGYLYALPVVELLVGCLMVLGWFTRMAGLIASLVLISILIAATGAWDQPNSMPHTNDIILGVTLLLMLAGPGSIALDNVRISKGGESIK